MKETYKDQFQYNKLEIEGKTKFSPSGFGTFYLNPEVWYRNNILKENRFNSNNNTVLGTLIHARIWAYWSDVPYEVETEREYVESYQDNVEVDGWKVLDEVDRIWEVLQVELPAIPKPDKVEQTVMLEIPESDYYIAGTYDYIRGNICGDIKTTSTTPKKIKVAHRIQLLIYILALKYAGVKITRMEIMYVVKLKKEPKVVVVSEPVTDEDLEWIKGQVKDMVTRLDLVKEKPELKDIVFFHNSDSYIK